MMICYFCDSTFLLSLYDDKRFSVQVCDATHAAICTSARSTILFLLIKNREFIAKLCLSSDNHFILDDMEEFNGQCLKQHFAVCIALDIVGSFVQFFNNGPLLAY